MEGALNAIHDLEKAEAAIVMESPLAIETFQVVLHKNGDRVSIHKQVEQHQHSKGKKKSDPKERIIWLFRTMKV
ncbi:MAG: hypothetical protein OQJ83_09035 [Altibacter sp.]|nr:hypothetical protein [Altibacter sp.]